MKTVDGPAAAAAFLDAERPRLEAAVARLTKRLRSGAPSALADALGYALGAPGKRLRPALCVAAYRGAGGSAVVPEPVYDAAAAIELIHTYSLVHDDLPCMDDDDLRRGRPTTHRVHGAATAAVIGAAMIPAACALLDEAAARLGARPGVRAEAVRQLASAAGGGGMVGGQWLDLMAEGQPLDVARLEMIHARKTGALFAASLRLGGLLAGASPAALDGLGACGVALGLAFQIADDVLDEVGVPAVLGKTAGRDRERSKATYPALVGLEAARERAAAGAAEAVAALRQAGLHDEVLEALIGFAVDRDR